MNARRERGIATVEFAIVGTLLFTTILIVMQFSILMAQRSLVTNATIMAAHLLASMRGMNTPYTRTNNALRAKLDGALASKADLDAKIANGDLTITMTIRKPFNCSSCATACNSDTSCAQALLSANEPPIVSTTATVSVNYQFTPLFSRFGATWWNSHSATATAVVQ